ncbi:MAG: biotin--[Lachnospiraceae bacterium]|nr:biotin--[acetyl-CoA-carboxylase] ligase [Lachnospiraceae bacterium]
MIHEAQMDSTNEVAKRAGDMGVAHGAVFWADSQTAGKGRRGRSWYSENQGNLYFTILLRSKLSPEKASMLTLVMAYAVAQAIRQETGLEALIKWPNDIVVQGKKVCGILSEMKLKGAAVDYCVVGVGVNVGQKQFAQDIQDKATSLDAELSAKTGELGQAAMFGDNGQAPEGISPDHLLQQILYYFEQEYECFEKAQNLAPMQEAYNSLLINLDRQVRVLDPKGEYEGIARGITRTGELLVETAKGHCQKVYAGEVSVRGLYGYV